MRVGELLCEQLRESDCTAEDLNVVWAQLKKLHEAEAHPMTESMLDALMGACQRTGGGLDAAIHILHDGKVNGLLSSSVLQTACVCSMMKWHGDDERMTFDVAVGLVDEWERTPDDFERLQSAYYVHFGEDPLCVGFWSSRKH